MTISAKTNPEEGMLCIMYAYVDDLTFYNYKIFAVYNYRLKAYNLWRLSLKRIIGFKPIFLGLKPIIIG